MTMPNQDDNEPLDSSVSVLEHDSVQPAVETVTDDYSDDNTATAGGEEEAVKQPVAKAAKAGTQTESSDKKKSSIESALDHLTRKSKKGEEEKPETPAKQPKESAANKPANDPKAQATKKDQAKPLTEASAEELGAMPERTRQRYQDLLADRKAIKAEHERVAAEYEAAKPDIERGKVFSEVVNEFGLQSDLASIEDEDVAGSIIFQAALVRLTSGKGTQADLTQVSQQFNNLAATMEHLGVSVGNKAPAVDVDAFIKALEHTEETLDFNDLRKLIYGIKKSEKPAQPAPIPAPRPTVKFVDERPPQPHVKQPLPAAASNAVDDGYYISKATQAIAADGITDAKAYFDKSLYPRILSDLKAAYPGSNPVDIFNRLSPQAKHDATIDAHKFVRTQSEKLKPAPPKNTPPQRQNASGGNSTAWQKPSRPASTANAAIDHLSGD